MIYIDLFCGIGSFHYSLRKLNAKCVMACDINKDCRDTYEKNYGIKPLGDIQTIEDIPDYDILCAGIPCQAYSNIGQHKGFDDDRGKLFFDVLKFIQTKDPKVVIIENVRGLVSHNNGESLKFIIDEITKLGFTCNYKVLACNDYGIPQMRKRLFIVFFKNSIPGIENVFDFPLCETPSLSEFLDKSLVKKVAYTIRCGGRMSPIDDKHNWDGYHMVDGSEYRLSVDDCKKLQGYEDFQLCGSITSQYKMLGNTIPTNLTYCLCQNIIKLISN